MKTNKALNNIFLCKPKELFAGNGMVGFVAKERVDGKLVLSEAMQILKMKGSGS